MTKNLFSLVFATTLFFSVVSGFGEAPPNHIDLSKFPATQLDDEHRPLILVQAAELRDFIVREMTDRKPVASDGSGGEREGLPGVPHVV